MKTKTWKQIEASRDRRLWISQIIIPTAALVVTVMAANPQIYQDVKRTASSVKTKITNKFNKRA